MANLYLCRMRTDLGASPASSLQILDLSPDSSQYDIYENPARGFYDSDFDGTQDSSTSGQTGYVGRSPDTETVMVTATDGAGDTVTQAAYTGLSAYLVDHVEATGAGGDALTGAEAVTAADAIVATMTVGAPAILATIDSALAAAGGAGTELTTAGGSASTGSLVEVLQLLSGAYYALPANSVTETPAGTFDPTEYGSFDSGKYRTFVDGDDLRVSRVEGDLSVFCNASFSYGGTTGAAVIMYDAAGAIITS